nr:integrase, catalytic region, zinc finger, CCHC-type, peptidase aspartic, catalytic [Tanacetum cinerariifolium]
MGQRKDAPGTYQINQKEDQGLQLYDDFEHFRHNQGETIHAYYVWFAKLINDMRNIKMTMSRMQLNSKFVNNMFFEWALPSTYVPPHLADNAHLDSDDCDVFDFDVDEAPMVQTMFMANLSFADPVYDEVDSSYDSYILSEVHDHDHYQDAVCEYHEEHEMHDNVLPNHVVDSHADYTSDSNMISYDQYVKDNAVLGVQSNVFSVPNDAYMMLYNDMFEPHAQSVSKTSRNTVVNNSLTAELATYKEQVELSHQVKAKALKEQTTASRPIKVLMVYPPDIPATLVPRVLPTKSQVKINIFTLIQLFSEFDKTCKKRITPTGLTERERGFEQTMECYLKETIVEARCLELKAELSNLRDKSHNDNHNELVNQFSNCEDNVIKQLKTQIFHLQETHSAAEHTLDFRALDSQITQLTEIVIVLQEQNDLFRAKNRKIKQHYKEFFDSIKITRVNCCTDASGSQPRSNTKKNRVSPAKGVNKMKVEEHHRTNKSHLRTTNRVDSSSLSKRTIVLWYLDSGCSKHMTGGYSRLINFVKKFIGTVRFRNDHFGAIMGYGDYVIGDSVISRNGVVERWNRTLVEAARTMLIFSKALMFLWAEAMATACYTQTDPLFTLVTTRPHMSCEDLGKLQPNADIEIFVGYAPSRKEPPRIERPGSPAPAVQVPINSAECLSCGTLYTRNCSCSKRNIEDKILVPKPPKNCARCAKCGHPVNGPYCQGCALLREKLEEDLVTYFQNFQNTSESSDDSINVVNAPREPVVVKQDPGVNPPHINECCCECGNTLDGIYCQQCICKSCGKGAHTGYNCPPKVSIISNPEPCNQTMNNELAQTLPSFDSTCYSDKENSVPCVSKPNFVDESFNIFNPPPQPPIYYCEFCGSNAQYGHYCTPQVPFINPEPGYSQDFNFPQNIHDFQQQ